jgi:DNA modification methylase
MVSPKIEIIRTDKLIPYARNARTHSDEQVSQIAGSIKEFGFTNPVLIDSDNGIIAGHGRVMAARVLGLAEVPCLRLSHLSETQRRAYILADNRIALNSGWDESMLALELTELNIDGFNLESLGFDSEEIDRIINQEGDLFDNQSDIIEDETPEVESVAITSSGEIWHLGAHKVLCGDCTNTDTIARIACGENIDVCVTDPPYGIGVDKVMHKSGGIQSKNGLAPKKHYAETDWDKLPPKDFIDKLTAYRQSIIFGGNYFDLPPSRCWLVWDKENGTTDFADCELAWTNLDKAVRIKRHLWNGFAIAGREERFNHPTQKPAAVMAWCIEMTEGVILDPFLGSGTTLIAAEQLGRICYGIEISPIYCDLVIRRWQTLTGNKAIREDGVTFDDLAESVNTTTQTTKP